MQLTHSSTLMLTMLRITNSFMDRTTPSSHILKASSNLIMAVNNKWGPILKVNPRINRESREPSMGRFLQIRLPTTLTTNSITSIITDSKEQQQPEQLRVPTLTKCITKVDTILRYSHRLTSRARKTSSLPTLKKTEIKTEEPLWVISVAETINSFGKSNLIFNYRSYSLPTLN